MNWKQEIKAIGWDLDGTLYPPETIPTELVYGRQIKALTDTHGWDPDHAKREFEKMYRQLGSKTKALSALGIDGQRFFLSMWDDLPLGEYLYSDKRLVEMFTQLSGMPHFILTNSNRRDQIERKLSLLGINPAFFTFLISSVEVGAEKPDARPFLAALERLGPEFTAHPESVLYVGDRLETDVIGAHRVRMKAAYVWGNCEAADISLASVYDISTALR